LSRTPESEWARLPSPESAFLGGPAGGSQNRKGARAKQKETSAAAGFRSSTALQVRARGRFRLSSRFTAVGSPLSLIRADVSAPGTGGFLRVSIFPFHIFAVAALGAHHCFQDGTVIAGGFGLRCSSRSYDRQMCDPFGRVSCPGRCLGTASGLSAAPGGCEVIFRCRCQFGYPQGSENPILG